MTAAELDALLGFREVKLVRHVLLQRRHGVDRTYVRFRVDIVWADINAARLGEWQVQLKLARADAERVFRQLDQAADIDEFQVAVSQAASAVVPGHADIVIHPEGDIAAEVASHKDAEESGFEIGARDDWRHGARSGQCIEAAGVGARELKEVIHAQADGRHTGNGARPDAVRPDILLRRRAQHHWGRFEERLVVFRKFEPGVFEGFAKVVELGKVQMASSARGAVLAGKGRNRIAPGAEGREKQWCNQDAGRNQCLVQATQFQGPPPRWGFHLVRRG